MSEMSEDTALQSIVTLQSQIFVSIHPIILKLSNFTGFKALFPAL